MVGRLQGNERGYGFVIPDDENIKDVFISADGLGGAMHKIGTPVTAGQKLTKLT